MNIKQKYRVLLTLSLILLISLTSMQSFAGKSLTGDALLQRYLSDRPAGIEKTAQATDDLRPSLAGARILPTDTTPYQNSLVNPKNESQVCTQLIVNPQLDVVLLGGGTGTAEPWVIIIPKVYYDDTIYTSPDYSLVVDIGDSGDPSPEIDAFAQAIFMPNNLTSVQVKYNRRIDWANGVDEVWVELWTVVNQSLGDPIVGWQVNDSPAGWATETQTVNNASILSQMEGRNMAIVLYNFTTDTSPGERTWFDDVTLTACFDSSGYASYLPANFNVAGTGPVCIPPSENPPDSWYNNRGLVETGANCNSTLSQLDDRDYYSYVPSQSGSHTVHLRNLPTGSNWSASVYNDVEPPPGGPTNGGTCYTSAPGDGDKSVVCNFNAGQKYVIKVSVGTTPMAGSYNMQVTRP